MPLPDPLKPYRLYAAMFLLNLAVVIGILYLLRRDPPRPILVTQPPPLPASNAPQIPAPIHVAVSGAVTSPGTLTLDGPARLADALQKAGLKPEADVSKLNLTQTLREGDSISVPARATTPSATNNLAPAATPPAVSKLNLNTATLADLDALPGIGPTLAQRILDHRAQIGGFTSIEQIKDVNGIGDTLFNNLKERITVP